MERIIAINIWEFLCEEARRGNDDFDLTITNDGTRKEKDFHEWVNKKKVIGIIELVRRIDKVNLYFVFIPWREKSKWYLVVFKGNKAGPIIEIWKTTTIGGATSLDWNYGPRKRDGKNKKRKKLFEKCYENLNVTINLPTSQGEISSFIAELFRLADIRVKADNLDENIVNVERNSLKNILSNKSIDSDSYLPTKNDFDAAIQKLKDKTSRSKFNVDEVLKQIETNVKTAGNSLHENWREITKGKLKTWSS